MASPQIRNMATVGGNICQEPRCWYYRYPENQFFCSRKGGNGCPAVMGENRYHSVFGAMRAIDAAVRAGLPGAHRHRRLPEPGAGRATATGPPPWSWSGTPCRRSPGGSAPTTARWAATGATGTGRCRCGSIERGIGDHVLDQAAPLLPGAAAAHREARRGGGLGPGRPGRRLLPAAPGARGHGVRGHARGGRHAGLRHPRLPPARRGGAAPGGGPGGHGDHLPARGAGRGARARRCARCGRATTGCSWPPAPGCRSPWAWRTRSC